MLRATFKSLLARKLRLSLSALSVVLGVAFVAGTLVLTDTINATFDTLFASADAGISVDVRAKSAFSSQGQAVREPVPESLLATVRSVPGVRTAVGTVDGFAQLVGSDGKAIRNGQAPSLGRTWVADPVLSPLHLRAGRGPVSGGELALDTSTADKHRLHVGDSIRVLLQTGAQRFRVVGLFTFANKGSLAGATLTAFDTATAQRVLGVPHTFSDIEVAGAPGVSQSALAVRVARVLPGSAEAVTGAQLAADESGQIKNDLRFFNTFLLVFAGISLFVGAFIIANTFSMLVAQRLRELALMRAIGASRGQVNRSVVVEALVVGLVGSTIGLGLGVLFALALKALLSAFGVDLPTTGLVFHLRTVLASYLVGTGVTVAAAVGPARKAGKVPPVAAMREGYTEPQKSLRRRTITGVVVTGAGGAVLVAGLAAGSATLVGLGALLVFQGASVLSPVLSRPVIRVLGAPLGRLYGTTGRLSMQNALRNPRRTAATASALMIGLALVAAFSVMGASLKSSFHRVFDTSLSADYLVTESGFTGFTPGVAASLAHVPGVAMVASERSGAARVAGDVRQLSAIQPEGLSQVLQFRILSGEQAALARGELLVSHTLATSRKWAVGQRLPVTFARTGPTTLTVGGIFRDNQLAGDLLVSTSLYARHFSQQLDQVVLVRTVPHAGAATRTAITRALGAFPTVKLQTQKEYLKTAEGQINSLLGLITALLALAIFIALMGIVNTLALSIVERTREIGMLRAIGLSRRQLRRMIRLEALVIAVYGALLGLVVGTFYGWALVHSLRSQGITSFAVPGAQLAVYVVLAGAAGVLAAVLPARRAGRLNVLRAISTA